MRTDVDSLSHIGAVSGAQKSCLDAFYRSAATDEPSSQLDARVMAMIVEKAEIRRERTRKTDQPTKGRPYIISSLASLLFLGMLLIFYPELIPLDRAGTDAALHETPDVAADTTKATDANSIAPPASATLAVDTVELGLRGLESALQQGNKPLFDRLIVAFEHKGYALSVAQQRRLDELKRRASKPE